MAWFKRIGLFLLTNILIITTISIITSVLGLNGYIEEAGLNYSALIITCALWGMIGALISLALSKVMAKWMMGVNVIDERNAGAYSGIVQSVRRLSATAKIPMPEVGVYVSPEINAFATGPTKSSALVAVSTGLLENMNENEIEGVLAHEISHISNGDMVTMTLIQGVVNSFALFLSRIISFAIGNMVREELETIVRIVSTIILDIVFSILGSMVVAYFSRMREYRADLGGAKLAGRENMIAALENLRRTYEAVDDRGAALASLKISGSRISLFSSHPPLEERIKALKTVNIH
ncbi:MAG: protease HtpX [Leptospiraceae bacterium]|nr:protease HtpX [Leptospiraceae bacterium]MCP5502469.1 protease HtpX [Leptospiraceae bacterium]